VRGYSFGEGSGQACLEAPEGGISAGEELALGLDPFDLALFDEDLEAFAAEVLHEGFGVEGFGHDDAAGGDFAGGDESGGEGWGDTGLDDGERIAELLIRFPVAVHGIDEVLDAFAVFGAADFGAHAGVSVDGSAKLGWFGEVGGGDAQGDDLNAVDLDAFPGIEIQEGQRSGDMADFVGEAVFEDGVFDAFLDERGVQTEADAFLVVDGVAFHHSDGVGEADPFDLRFERFTGADFAVLHVVGGGAEFLEEGFRGEENGEAVTFDFGVVGVEDADTGDGVEAIDGPAGEDIDGAGIHTHAEDAEQVVVLEGFVEAFNFGLKGLFAGAFSAWGVIDIGGHVEVMRAALEASLEDGVIDAGGAGVEGDLDLVFSNEGGYTAGIGGVELADLEPAGFGEAGETLGEGEVDVSEDDSFEAIVGMKLMSDD